LEAAAVAFGIAMVPEAAFAEGRPVYLTEPTDEFLENERKSMIFKREQIALKKEFYAAMEKFPSEPDDADVLVKDIQDFQDLVIRTKGLPVGLKKDELFKVIRSKKAKGFWPTPVEIA
jgi:hypothetical protein